MIVRLEAALRRLRRKVSRSEWLGRLLRLAPTGPGESGHGLLMVQIDGLAHDRIAAALADGSMPFLRRLLRRDHYVLHRLFAGVPASTAAFQAELFYGAGHAVPGFGFMFRDSGELVNMIQARAVARVEDGLARESTGPLLAGGSVYSDIFTGGAAESHFCPTARGWGPALRQAGPLVTLILLLANARSLLRILALATVELVLAVTDFFRGLVAGQDLWRELSFVPVRVLITIVLRELVTIGARIDLARGLPVIHLNLLGYDEQAHRRGPDSRFAQWTLKGIDRTIRDLYRAAHASHRRRYDVWIYSDHGQATARPYHALHHADFAEAVAGVFARAGGEDIGYRAGDMLGEQLKRVQLVGGRVAASLTPSGGIVPVGDPAVLAIAHAGPVAMIYWARPHRFAERRRLARLLVEMARIPAVLALDDDGEVHAWTDDGEFRLPADGDRIVGRDHPFRTEVVKGLVELCRQPHAGDFVACGWVAGRAPVTFARENGCHGGFSPAETTAFALLPSDAALPSERRGAFLRIADLRKAALALRTRGVAAARPARLPPGTVRVMTYNVHSCIGMDGRASPERIARLIARHRPDIVALQELDLGRARSRGDDQARLIARMLEMDYHFHAALRVEEEQYGDAILSRFPMRVVKAGRLPGLPRKSWLEPRGAIWAAVDMGGAELQVLNTHLGLDRRERRLQVEALLGRDWLLDPACRAPVLLCGDLNALPFSAVCRRLATRLRDAQRALGSHRPKATFFGRLPIARIDYVFADPAIEVAAVQVDRSHAARLASDHLPLIVDFRLPAVRAANHCN